MWNLCLIFLFNVPFLLEGSDEELNLCHFLKKLYDLDSLPHLEEEISSDQTSSYNRLSRYNPDTDSYSEWYAGEDHGHYIRTIEETGEAVMADLKGPGCITRIWSADPKGRIRFYLDGRITPLDFSFADLCSGKIHPFEPPLVWRQEG
ncbi:MAG: hypothetical protein ABIK28_12325, partial [Planctomycetota bacterium]